MLRLFIFFCISVINAQLLFGQNLVINEFMASNSDLTEIVDDFDESDDWVELFNGTSADIDLGGYYLSDDFAEPDKWTFPAGISIDANGYLIIWTDKDDEQGDLHTSFKLKIDGEALMLSDTDLMIIDSVSFGLQETNIPMARVPNGTGSFVQQVATFNGNNDEMLNTTTPSQVESLTVFPNPAKSFTQVDMEFKDQVDALNIQVINHLGQSMSNQLIERPRLNEQIKISVEDLSEGIYWIVFKMEKTTFVRPIEVIK